MMRVLLALALVAAIPCAAFAETWYIERDDTPFDPSPNCLATFDLRHNFSADPQFCGVPGSGLYTLQSDSPCAPGTPPTGSTVG